MEETEPRNGATGSRKKVVLVIVAMIAVVAIAVGVTLAVTQAKDTAESGAPRIGYSTEAKVMLDEDSLQAAMDAAIENSKDGNVALLYKNNAFSDDGTNFECYIVNSQSNIFDMFITIYADAELTDQIYLSELVPPGSGFENITLEHALEPGDHRVYVALTQVADDEEGNQVIKNQVMHTMDFHVRQ